jgi:neutral ceramidase
MQRRALPFVMLAALFCLIAFCVHPGRAGAAEQLLAGVASVEITPPPGLLMWGYSNRPQPATGKLDPLMARALVLACGDTRAAVVTLDLGRTPEDQLLAALRARTLAKYGVGDLLVTASHTHAAPSLESLDDVPNKYGPTVIEAIDKAIGEAVGHLVPVRLGVGRGTVDIAHNRRHFLPDGRVAMQWRNIEHEPTSPVDKQFVVVRFDHEDGTPLAFLLHYACHPVVLGPDNLEYSADFVGVACHDVEDKLKAPCLYLQGGCGNINPYADKTPLSQGGVAEMRKAGATLAAAATQTARDTKALAEQPTTLKFEARPVPVRVRWNIRDPEVKAVLSKAYGPRFDRYLAGMLKSGEVRPELTTLLIGDAVALVGMPGEMFVEFQIVLKTQSPVPTTLLVGYANGYHAYFPTIRDAAAGGYGGKTATYVAPGAGERLTDEALVTLYKMIGKLHDVPRAEDFQLLEYDDVKK